MRNKSSCSTASPGTVNGSPITSTVADASGGAGAPLGGYWLRWSTGAVQTYPSLKAGEGLPEPQCVLPLPLVEARWGQVGALRSHWVIVQSFGRRVLCLHPAGAHERGLANPWEDGIALNSTAWAVLGGHLPALGDVMWAWLPEAALPGCGGPDRRFAGHCGDTIS